MTLSPNRKMEIPFPGAGVRTPLDAGVPVVVRSSTNEARAVHGVLLSVIWQTGE